MPGSDWRPLRAADLPGVAAIAALVHPGYPEGEAVFAERLALGPRFCLALEGAGRLLGYALAHPWAGPPPPLDTLLGALPARPAALHLHDIALLPQARGHGHAAMAIGRLLAAARQAGLAAASLVAVAGKEAYWRRHGFAAVAAEPGALASYGDAAVLMRRGL